VAQAVGPRLAPAAAPEIAEIRSFPILGRRELQSTETLSGASSSPPEFVKKFDGIAGSASTRGCARAGHSPENTKAVRESRPFAKASG